MEAENERVRAEMAFVQSKFAAMELTEQVLRKDIETLKAELEASHGETEALKVAHEEQCEVLRNECADALAAIEAQRQKCSDLEF